MRLWDKVRLFRQEPCAAKRDQLPPTSKTLFASHREAECALAG